MLRLCAWVKSARVSGTGLLALYTCVGIFSNAEGATAQMGNNRTSSAPGPGGIQGG